MNTDMSTSPADIVLESLRKAFPVAEVKVTVQGGNNFNIFVQCLLFSGMMKVKQHKLVYGVLMDSGVDFHAVQISTKAS